MPPSRLIVLKAIGVGTAKIEFSWEPCELLTDSRLVPAAGQDMWWSADHLPLLQEIGQFRLYNHLRVLSATWVGLDGDGQTQIDTNRNN